jgi:hypothetical protein
MSALPGFVIEVDVDDEKGVFDFSWNWASDWAVVDEPSLQSIFTSRGDVHVSSVVISNAVQASVEFLLFTPLAICNITGSEFPDVEGELVLKTENLTLGRKIFQSGGRRAAHLDEKKKSYLSPQECEGKDAMKVPLTRRIFALPVVCGLRVTGTLDLCGGTLRVPIDHHIELKDQGRLCKWQVNSSNLDGAPAVTHAAIRFNIISPF